MAKFIIGFVIGALIVWGGFTLLSDSGSGSQGDAIKIGFIGPLTGDGGNIGENAKAAIEIAVAEVNEAGGIDGRELEVIYEDGQCLGKEASNAASKLINVDKVPVILGGACSGETLAFAPAAEEAKVVTLSYCSSAPAITDAGDYIFRNYPSDTFQGAHAATYAKETLDAAKVGILYVNADWGVGIKDVFKKEFEALGGEVVLEEGYDQQSRDLRTQLTKVKDADPDLVYFLGYTEASIPGIKQAAELGIAVPILGGDAWDDPKIFQEAGTAADGIKYVVPDAVLGEEFEAKLKEKVGSDEIAVCTPSAYDALKLMAQVIEKVGTDSEAIKDELYNTTYTGGVSNATISFDENGDLKGANYVVKVVKDGVATVESSE
jgi:branched-chain amino acid transport system substrate-binding protein